MWQAIYMIKWQVFVLQTYLSHIYLKYTVRHYLQ